VNEVVLDASALLALIHREDGWERVDQMMHSAIMSAVNVSEVVAKMVDVGLTERDIRTTLAELGIVIADFDQPTAIACGLLRPATSRLGLSLGDRACLALAQNRNAPAITTDRQWQEVDIGVTVVCVR
jgi:PIN domain nuclease of toxin-antitoxin system